MLTSIKTLPVVVIGAGPVGLAAAARLVERDLPFVVLERGAVAASVAAWAHVRVFSAWEHNVDAAARSLLEGAGWTMPDPDYLPTGAELIAGYLAPLAAHPAIAPHLRLETEVVAVTRENRSKLASEGRADAPFVVVCETEGAPQRIRARAVIDASGTWGRPNPIGLDGLPIDGEAKHGDRIAYGIPDVLGAARQTYAGRHTLVVGAGHSAINAALDLIDLQRKAPGTRITWATRGGGVSRLLGGGAEDELAGRGSLGLRAAEAVRSGRVELRSPLAVRAVSAAGEGLRIAAEEGGRPTSFNVDRIVVATGFRPDLSMLRELRLSLDPVVETTPVLAPLIDPNLHSCGTVRPHGAAELSHPEPGLYVVGMKSYGRAPTFLMATGYEQVRSVVAELAGDHAAAREVRLRLPETGVCRTRPSAALTADGPRQAPTSACCMPARG